MKTYWRLLSYAKPFGRFAVPYFIFSLIGTVFSLFQLTSLMPILEVLFEKVNTPSLPAQPPEFHFTVGYVTHTFQYYLTYFLTTHGKLGALKFVSAMIIVATLIGNVFKYLAQRVLESVNAYSVRNLRQAAFAKSASLHLGFFSSERKGDIIARLTTDVREVENTVAGTMVAFLKEPFQLIAYFVTLFIISTKLTLFTLIVIPVAGIIISAIVKQLRRDAKASQESISVLTSMIDEAMGGLRVIKAFNAVEYVKRKFTDENNRYAHSLYKMNVKRESATPVSEVLAVLVVAGIVLYGGSLVLSNRPELPASQFIGYIVLFSQVIQPAKGIANGVSSIQRGLVAGKRVLELMDAEEQIVEKPHAVPVSAFVSDIRFEKVSFAYGERTVLRNVSFTLEKGKCIALVGPSGGGKSTIADLIPRFYDVSDGRITIDGVDLRDCRIDSLRDQMGIVTQESILFNDTIFNNIAFGKTKASFEEVIRAAKVANAHEFITQTENGYDTVIGDRGMKLSGGQRQRLSIARAVFKNPPILILDEATSALDTESEKLVQEALFNLMKNRTTLVIAHRLSTIQHADEILVIQQGEIVERGSHSLLLQNEEGLYHKLSALQTTV